MTPRIRFVCRLAAAVAVATLAACSTVQPPPEEAPDESPAPQTIAAKPAPQTVAPAKLGAPLKWRQLPGWRDDKHAEAWPALLQSCRAMTRKDKAEWKNLCYAANAMARPDDDRARAFFERWFTPRQLFAGDRARGLITGYYEPLLRGSFSRDARYRYPLYAAPESLLTVQLGALFPALKGKRVRGRLVGDKIVPFYERAEIDSDANPLAGDELLWVDDRDDAFFLHIQGSGRVQLPDGQIVGVGYANQNGHPYRAIGKILLDRGELQREEISLFSIRRWLRDNPARAEELLFANPSYVFFVLRENPGAGPVGSLNVPLTAERSLAIDPKSVDLGLPVWLISTHPATDQPYRRLVFAQDTGGAIKGALRADLFWGHGEEAERAAGGMKHRGSLVVLVPKVK